MADHQAPPLDRERLFTMMAGYKNTAVIRACVDLAVFDALAAGPREPGELATQLGTPVDGLTRLLAAAAGIGLLARNGTSFELLPGTGDLLVSTSPGYCAGIIRVIASDLEWGALGQLAGTVRRGAPSADLLLPDHPYWVDFAAHSTFVTRVMSELVVESVAPHIAGRSDLTVLDAGCGPGSFGFALAAAHPSARIYAQDWPAVLAVAEQHAKRRDVLDRTTLLPGDVHTINLGGPYDVVIAANLLFHFPPAEAGALLHRFTEVLAPDGVLVVAGFTTGDRPAADEGHAALLSLLMLTATAGGTLYSTEDYRQLLTSCGLVDVTVHTRPNLLPRVLVARRAPSA